ncbi:MAG: hypothetical protein KF724_01780 [Phycisphaeraceae bacterium]|nr:hypothetical protein [Phycisphaeraceae bacterium]
MRSHLKSGLTDGSNIMELVSNSKQISRRSVMGALMWRGSVAGVLAASCGLYGCQDPGPPKGPDASPIAEPLLSTKPMTPRTELDSNEPVEWLISGMSVPAVNGAPAANWSALLQSGKLMVGGGPSPNPAGSVELASGLLYINQQTTQPPQGASMSLFPIVVTSGPVRGGSVGTAWICWKDLPGNVTYFALLTPGDNVPAGPSSSTLFVLDMTPVPGHPDGRTVKLVEHDTFVALRGHVFGPDVPAILPIAGSAIETMIVELKNRAKHVGLRP